MAKVVNEIKEYTTVFDMKDGDVALVINWTPNYPDMRMKVIQRYGNSIVVIGEHSDNSFNSVLGIKPSFRVEGEYIVKILPKGTLIEL